MKILSIETSCDETAAAVIENGHILANVVASQINIHKKTGGVVPEVASRAHVEKIIPVIDEALDTAKTKLDDIDAIAVTTGPGLVGSLLVGVEAAKTLAYAINKPIIPINHLEGHIYANWINYEPKLPAVALTVSGGHTSLIYIKKINELKVIGETLDDAAGEAYDKVAQILGLGYPGGPAIDQACLKDKSKIKIDLPRPMLDRNDFSFSGLKTAVLYKVMKLKLDAKTKNQVANEFQKAMVETLVSKTIETAKKRKAKTVLLSGGVAANKFLRSELEKVARDNGFEFHVPEFQYCTDNAAMIARAAEIKLQNKKPRDWSQIEANANLGL